MLREKSWRCAKEERVSPGVKSAPLYIERMVALEMALNERRACCSTPSWEKTISTKKPLCRSGTHFFLYVPVALRYVTSQRRNHACPREIQKAETKRCWRIGTDSKSPWSFRVGPTQWQISSFFLSFGLYGGWRLKATSPCPNFPAGKAGNERNDGATMKFLNAQTREGWHVPVSSHNQRELYSARFWDLSKSFIPVLCVVSLEIVTTWTVYQKRAQQSPRILPGMIQRRDAYASSRNLTLVLRVNFIVTAYRVNSWKPEGDITVLCVFLQHSLGLRPSAATSA